MARRKKRRRSKFLRPFRGLIERIGDFRRVRKAYRSPERQRALRRNLQRTVSSRAVVPPLILTAIAWGLIALARSMGMARVNVAACGTWLLSASLDAMNYWHRISDLSLEFPTARIQLYSSFEWLAALLAACYAVALYLAWIKAKWPRAAVTLALVPVVFWFTPLALITALALVGKTQLLEAWSGKGLVVICAVPAILTVYSIDHCFLRSRHDDRTARPPAWMGSVCAMVVGAASLSCIYLLLASWLMTPEKVVAKYRAAAAKSLHRGELPIARLTTRRLAGLTEEAEQDQFLAAMTSKLAGDNKAAKQQMTALAALPDGGYKMAHLWLAQQLLAERGYPDSETEASQLLSHLELGVQRQEHNAELWLDVDEVSREAKRFVAEFRLGRARTHSAAGNISQAQAEGLAARKHYQDLIDENPDDIEFALQLVECSLVSEDFALALSSLQESAEKIPADILGGTINRLYVSWYDALSRDPANNRSQRLKVLKEGLHRDPRNRQLLSRLSALLSEPGIDDQEATALLADARQLGTLPATVHFVLAGQAAGKNDLNTALAHYEQANSLEPDEPLILDGFARCLVRIKPPDLDRALELSNRAVQVAPQRGAPRETRGQILALKQQWSDAVEDLEFALSASPNRALAIHRTLAQAYEQLGKPAAAAKHRRQLQE